MQEIPSQKQNREGRGRGMKEGREEGSGDWLPIDIGDLE